MSLKRNFLLCSFCGKSQEEVSKIIAGPAVYICDECVFLCLQVLFDESVKRVGILEALVRDLEIGN